MALIESESAASLIARGGRGPKTHGFPALGPGSFFHVVGKLSRSSHQTFTAHC